MKPPCKWCGGPVGVYPLKQCPGRCTVPGPSAIQRARHCVEAYDNSPSLGPAADAPEHEIFLATIVQEAKARQVVACKGERFMTHEGRPGTKFSDWQYSACADAIAEVADITSSDPNLMQMLVDGNDGKELTDEDEQSSWWWTVGDAYTEVCSAAEREAESRLPLHYMCSKPWRYL